MSWICTESGTSTGRWGSADTEDFAKNGGIPDVEWFNTDTGAGYLLTASGGWQMGGEFHLLFKPADSDVSVDVSRLLWPAETRAFSIDPNEWGRVERDLQHLVSTLLNAESLPAKVREQ